MTVTMAGKPMGLELCVLPTTEPYSPNTNRPGSSENPVLLPKASVPLVVTSPQFGLWGAPLLCFCFSYSWVLNLNSVLVFFKVLYFLLSFCSYWFVFWFWVCF